MRCNNKLDTTDATREVCDACNLIENSEIYQSLRNPECHMCSKKALFRYDELLVFCSLTCAWNYFKAQLEKLKY